MTQRFSKFWLIVLTSVVSTASQPQDENPRLYPVTHNGKYGFIDSNGVLVIQANYDNAGNFKHGLSPVNVGGRPYGHHFRGGKWGFIDREGNIAIQSKFDFASEFNEGLAPVAIQNDTTVDGLPVLKWGFVNRDGQIMVSFQYVEVAKFSHGRASVKIAGRWGAIDREGNLVIKPQYRHNFQFTQGCAWVQCENFGWGIIDTNGVQIRPCNVSLKSIEGFHEGLSVVGTKKDRWLILDLRGNIVLDLAYEWITEFRHGLARITDKGKSHFIDASGNVVLRTDFDWTGEEGDGLALVRTKERYGFADERTWKVVIPLNFFDAEPFQSGLAAVRLEENGKVGFIVPTGKMVIPPTYNRASNFDGPLCLVWLNCENSQVPCERAAYINKSGQIVWINN